MTYSIDKIPEALKARLNKIKRRIERTFIHCSASDHPDHDNIATMDRWHKQRGWSGVGYHIFIRKDGSLEFGRDLNKTPAAQGGHNKGTIAICLHGLKKDKFTLEQYAALQKVCSEINNHFKGKVSFHGHCEVAHKSCPVIDYKTILNLDEYGNLGGNNEPVFASEKDAKDELLRMGARGDKVKYLQELLNIKPDGIFGPNTQKAVKKFQKDNNLKVDGIVGKATWAELGEL